MLIVEMLPNVGVPDTFAYATAFAVAAFVTSPDTLAPATALAVAANDTSPVTLAPVMFDN
jgi:hypothetical protein